MSTNIEDFTAYIHGIKFQVIIWLPFNLLCIPWPKCLRKHSRCQLKGIPVRICKMHIKKLLAELNIPSPSGLPVRYIAFEPNRDGKAILMTWVGPLGSPALVKAILPLLGLHNARLGRLKVKAIEVFINLPLSAVKAVERFIRRYLTTPYSSHVLRIVPAGTVEDEEASPWKRSLLEAEFVCSVLADFLPARRRPIFTLRNYDVPRSKYGIAKMEPMATAPKGQSWNLEEAKAIIKRIAGLLLHIRDVLGFESKGLVFDQEGEAFVYPPKARGKEYDERLYEVVSHAAKMSERDGLSHREGRPKHLPIAAGLLACRVMSDSNLSHRMDGVVEIRYCGDNDDAVRTLVTEAMFNAATALGTPML